MGFLFRSVLPGSLMGILNITPDSFSEGGRDFDPAAAVGHGMEMVGAGAVVLDLGAEASSFFRDGIAPVVPEEQLRRLLPVVRTLVRRVPEVPLSIDTRSALVAEACLAEGAAIINDISAGTQDVAMLPTVARHGAAAILMHIMPEYPATASDDADIVGRVRDYLAQRVAAAEAAGIARERLAVDPGLGFGKSATDNWRLIARLESLAPAGVAVVLGASRKRFLATLPPPELGLGFTGFLAAAAEGPHPRDRATAALTTLVGQRAQLHRVHAMS